MTNNLKIEVLVSNIPEDGSIASQFPSQEYVNQQLAKKANLSPEGRLDPSHAPDYTEIPGLYEHIEDTKDVIETSIASSLQDAKGYTNQQLSEGLRTKADLINGKIPFDQIPFSADIEEQIQINVENITAVVDQKVAQVVGQVNQAATAANAYTDTKVAENKTYVDNTIGNVIEDVERLGVSKAVTIPTYLTPEAGVALGTGVAAGAYYNVRSTEDETALVEYQNVGGAPTPSGKSYPSGSALDNIQHNNLKDRDDAGAHPASAILDKSGKTQQEVNDTIVKKITTVAELSSYKPNAGDIFYIAEKDAHFEVMGGTADNILSFLAGAGSIAKLKHDGEITYKNIGSTASNLAYAVNNDTTIAKVIGDELIIDSIVKISRSNLELKFNNLTYPTTIDGGNNALSSLIEFKGEVVNDNLDQYVLVNDLPEFSEHFPVSNITKFNVGDWVIISNGTSPQKINYMCRVLELNIDKIKVDYRLGWTLSAGDTLSFKKVEPISNVKIKVKKWDYLPTDTRETARAGVLLQYAHDCKVADSEFNNTFWPCVVGRHTHSCGVIDNKMNNPQSTATGGDGYLVQWSASLYMRTEGNTTHNDRHLHDITMGAYASIQNNKSINSKDGGFVTHGQYEHDLYYENNVGVLSFANSGPIFGQRAKRLTVNKHNAQAILASAGVIDLTMNDVVCQNHASLNVDGLQSSNLQVHGGISFSNGFPKMSKRQNILSGGFIKHLASMSFSTSSMSSHLTLKNVNIEDFTQATINGTGILVLDECECIGTPSGNSNLVAISGFKIKGGAYTDIGFRWFTATDQSVTIDSPVVSGVPTSGSEFIGNRKTGGNAIIKIINMDSDLTSGFHYSVTQSSGSCCLDVINGVYKNGSVRYQQATANLTGSYLHIRGTTEKTVVRNLPIASARVKLGECLILT